MQDCADYIMMMFALFSSWNIKNYEYLYFISSSCFESISCLSFSGDIFFSLEYARKQFDSLRNCHGRVCLYVLVSMNIQEAKEINIKGSVKRKVKVNQQQYIMNNLSIGSCYHRLCTQCDINSRGMYYWNQICMWPLYTINIKYSDLNFCLNKLSSYQK